MEKELKEEIEFNLQNREDFKKFTEKLKTDNKSICSIPSELLAVKISTMEANYDDFGLFLLKLLDEQFLTLEETKYIIGIVNDNEDSFSCDSDELYSEIEKIVDLIDDDNVELSVEQLKKKCKDKYELYVLQRAAFTFDYVVELND